MDRGIKMRHLFVLLASLILFTACDKAKFDSGGSSEKSANGFEVVTEEEEVAILGEDDTPDEGVVDDTCTGEDCPTNDDDGDDGKGDDDGDDSKHTCRDRKHGHKDGDHPGKQPHKDCEDCVVSPDTIYKDDKIKKDHDCGTELQDHKIHICKWPNGDESKEKTLCVAKASLSGMVKERRQDEYYVGTCPEIGNKSKEQKEDESDDDDDDDDEKDED